VVNGLVVPGEVILANGSGPLQAEAHRVSGAEMWLLNGVARMLRSYPPLLLFPTSGG
jgi:hypothetical protein